MKIHLRIPNYFKFYEGRRTYKEILKSYKAEAKLFAKENPHLGPKKQLIEYYMGRVITLYKEGRFK